MSNTKYQGASIMRRMSEIINIIRNASGYAIISVVVVALAGCASNRAGIVPDTPEQLGVTAYTPGSAEEFTATVGDRVFFDTDSSELTFEARVTLDQQAAWLNQYPQNLILVEGHADERGTREYNLALGARRAAATRDYLTNKGVLRDRIKTISFGKERPVAVCNDISCWSQNRRAVSILNP